MNNLEKLEQQAKKDQAVIDKLRVRYEDAKDAVMRDPEDSKSALEATAFSMQVMGAKKALEATLQAIEREKERIYDQEVQTARARLADIEKQTDKIRQDQMTKAYTFFKAYQEWSDLVDEHAKIVNQYRITDVSNVRTLDEGGSGMWLLKNTLERWRGALSRETRERLESQNL